MLFLLFVTNDIGICFVPSPMRDRMTMSRWLAPKVSLTASPWLLR